MLGNYDFLTFDLKLLERNKLCQLAITVATMHLRDRHVESFFRQGKAGVTSFYPTSISNPCYGVIEVRLGVMNLYADGSVDGFKLGTIVTFFDGNVLAGLPGWFKNGVWQPHLVKVHDFGEGSSSTYEGSASFSSLEELKHCKLLSRDACRGALRVHEEVPGRYSVVLEGTPEFRDLSGGTILPEVFSFLGFDEWVSAQHAAAALIRLRTLQTQVKEGTLEIAQLKHTYGFDSTAR